MKIARPIILCIILEIKHNVQPPMQALQNMLLRPHSITQKCVNYSCKLEKDLHAVQSLVILINKFYFNLLVTFLNCIVKNSCYFHKLSKVGKLIKLESIKESSLLSLFDSCVHGHAIFKLCDRISSQKRKRLQTCLCLFIWGPGRIF